MICHRDMPAIRRNPTIWQRLNPIWWFADDYHPASIQLYSGRNFAMNFLATIVGIECLPHRWIGTMPNTFPNWGPGFGISFGRCIPRPYVCWRGVPFWWRRFFLAEIAIGWKPAGAFSITIRAANATPA